MSPSPQPRANRDGTVSLPSTWSVLAQHVLTAVDPADAQGAAETLARLVLEAADPKRASS